MAARVCARWINPPGTYLMKHAGETLWQGERPFSLRVGVVGNGGEVAGFSVTSNLVY